MKPAYIIIAVVSVVVFVGAVTVAVALVTIINPVAVGGGKHRKQLSGSPEQHDSSGRTRQGRHSQHTAR